MFWKITKQEMKRKKITQEKLANLISENYNTVRNWISKDIKPDVDTGLKIANALNVNLIYLITGKKEEKYEKIKQKLKNIRNDLNDIESHF